MNRIPLRLALPLGLAAALFSITSAAGESNPSSPDAGAFGSHVAECAQAVGFDGAHNPGMHRGFSSWMPGHDCLH